MWHIKRWFKIFVFILILLWVTMSLNMIDPMIRTRGDQASLDQQVAQTKKEIKILELKGDELQKEVEALEKQIDNYKRSQFYDVIHSDAEYHNENISNILVAKNIPGGRKDMMPRKDLDAPSMEYEITRRRLRRDINEFWWFLKAALKAPMDNEVSMFQHFDETLNEAEHRHGTLISILSELQDFDGYASWRNLEAADLSEIVQKRLYALQNPSDCLNAKKLLCNLNKLCGFGCQLHHVVYCFIVAYATERTLMLYSENWRYDKAGFEEVFKPLSENCGFSKEELQSRVMWPGDNNTRMIELPIIEYMHPRPEFLPPSIPEDISDRIITLHGDPPVWWISQFLKFLLRPQQTTFELLKEVESQRYTKVPMVGIHIRRTDKLDKEAAFHGVEEYMKHVKTFFQQVEINTGNTSLSPKIIYIASDDPGVFSECRTKYPEYTFLGDEARAQSAKISSRYNKNSLLGLISDIHMLSLSDYIVCTFSSQVCRLAYEIQQQRYVDGSWRFKSLDDTWYFGGADHHQEVIMAHEPNNIDELNLKIGDTISVAGNHWNGYNKGRNHANDQIGLYPLYKTRERYKTYPFPTYHDIHL